MNSRPREKMGVIRRWFRFNAVGAMGICIQLIAAWLFGTICGLDSLWATALAVEAAVLHNFLWHQCFTWADRRAGAPRSTLQRLLAFNATTGAVSIAGNVLLVSLLLHLMRAPLLAANLASVALCSVFTFLINDKLVFRSRNAASPASQ